MGKNEHLSPVRFPASPKPGESLIGFIARVVAENVLGTTQRVIGACGGTVVPPARFALQAERQIKQLAHLLCPGSDAGQVEAMVHPSMGSDAGGTLIRWGERTMRSRDLVFLNRAISPLSLQTDAYHRELWMVRLLPYCPESFERLVERCSSCGDRLCWTRAEGIGKCEHCRVVVSASGERLPHELRQAFAWFADLLSPVSDVAERARAALHDDLAALSLPSFIDLVFDLGRLQRPKGVRMAAYHSLPDGPVETARTIERGMAFISEWPSSIQAIAAKALTDRTSSGHLLDRLRTLQRREDMSEATGAITKALPELRVSRRQAAPAGAHTVMLGNELKARGGLQPADIARLRTEPSLAPVVTHHGERVQVQFDREAAERLIEAKRTSLSPKSVGERLAIPTYGVLQCIAVGLLEIEEHPALRLACPGFRVTGRSFRILRWRLYRNALKQHGQRDHGLRLNSACRIFGGGLKPWSGIISELITGAIPYWKAVGAPVSADLIRVDEESVALLVNGARFQNSDHYMPSHLSKRDVEDVLNVPYSQVVRLENSGELKFTGRGKGAATSLAAVLQLAEKRIFPAEAGAVLGHRHSSIVQRLERKGLQQLPGGGWDRAEFSSKFPRP